ncbi:MAG: putative DNA binding domain-containing protein [Thermomicrobiales bacterium]|nr:putative DNA binding domain-containing protein [Thermomicrobiales bacterium]
MSRSRRSRSGDRSQRDQHELAWRRIDLHLHTPASIDYQDPDITYLDILRKAEARGADMIAFTDHNTVRGYANMWREIEDLELLEALERLSPTEQRRLDDYRRILKHIRVLPGFELTATFGFHILAIFPEGTSIRQIEHTLLELNVPEDRIDLGTSEVGATVDVLTAYETLDRVGALVIPAHVNSTHGVAMQNLPFGGQTKIAFTQSQYIDALEATDLDSSSRRSTARFFNGSKPEYPRRMHIIQGSDAHRLNRDPNRESNLGVCDRMTEVLVPEVSFAALKELFRSDSFNRVRPYRPEHDPYDFIRIARAEGETIVQSFHELVPRRGRLSPVVRDAAAFANGNGGTIYVGISATPKDPVAGVEQAPEHARAIAEDLARYITPQITGSIDIQDTDSKQIIVVQIPAGDDMPYAVLPSTIYVRQEGETTVAMRDEIVQLVVDGLKIERGELPELVAQAVQTAPEQAEEAPEPTRSRSSRRRGRGRSSQAHQATSEEAVDSAHHDGAADVSEDATMSPEPEPEPVASVSPAPSARDVVVCNDIPFPRTGVEVVDTVEADGVIYHAMRDLRNLKIVHNVTRDSARRLWRYAITQLELHPARDEDVTWHGDRGYWKAYKPRGGDVRYNLVHRHDDHLHVFYGVTDEGLDDDWRDVIPPRYLSRSTSNGDDHEADTNGVVSESPAAPEQSIEAQSSAEESAPESAVVDAAAVETQSADDSSALAASPETAIQPAPVEPTEVVEQPASPAEPEAETVAEPVEKPKPVRRRRKPAATATEPATVPEEAVQQAEPAAEAEAEKPKPVRRRRTTTKKAAEPEAAAAEEQPPAEPEPTTEAEPEKPKPTRRRRTTKKAAEEAGSVVDAAPGEAEPAAAPAAEATPEAEPEKPKPVRRRRTKPKAAEATASDEPDRPAEE